MKQMDRTRILAIAAQMEAMGYILRENRVAVVRDLGDQMVGSIIVPDQAKEKPLSGIVVSIGAGIRQDQAQNGEVSRYHGLEIGDWLTFSKYDGIRFRIPLMDGDSVDVEVLHGFDIYFSVKTKKAVL